MLVTQNIDGLHTDELLTSKILKNEQIDGKANGLNLFNPNVQEIQGNPRYMYCTNEDCGSKYYSSPSAEECKVQQDNAFCFENELGNFEKIIEVPRC